jgi:hypothetical protein
MTAAVRALASCHLKQVVHHDVPPAASQSIASESWDLTPSSDAGDSSSEATAAATDSRLLSGLTSDLCIVYAWNIHGIYLKLEIFKNASFSFKTAECDFMVHTCHIPGIFLVYCTIFLEYAIHIPNE